MLAITAPAASTPAAAQAPGLQGGVGRSASCRRPVRQNASRASRGSRASPIARLARYSEFGANVSVMVPGFPAGTTQACCHPLTAIGVSRAPVLVRATQPELMLSGTTSTREVADSGTRTSRWVGPHAPVSAEVTVALDNPAPGVDNWAPSTTNAAPGLISNSCCPAGSAIGSRSHGSAATGSPSSKAPTVVRIKVCTNRPATATTGP
ncbi:Uncharacterised protein [Mycobacterium tuberculosis]|nr:Uncharacterised protein [Mycobacterium tuberculosis]